MIPITKSEQYNNFWFFSKNLFLDFLVAVRMSVTSLTNRDEKSKSIGIFSATRVFQPAKISYMVAVGCIILVISNSHAPNARIPVLLFTLGKRG